MTLPIAESWYRRESLADGVTWLTEPHVDPFARCNIWHVRGRDRDLLVDTGLGVVSLKRAALDLFEHPVICALTHSHFDHVGGAAEQQDRRIHQAELEELTSALGFAGLTAEDLGDDLVRRLSAAGYDVPDVLLDALPYEGFGLAGYRHRPAPPTALLRDQDVLDLGDRTFEVLHVPGHSRGSIALWEARTGILFSGDALYDGPLLHDLGGSDLQDYARTLERLRSLPVNIVHAGHEPSFGRIRCHEIIAHYLEIWTSTRARNP